jgi:hypothetical protein
LEPLLTPEEGLETIWFLGFGNTFGGCFAVVDMWHGPVTWNRLNCKL